MCLNYVHKTLNLILQPKQMLSLPRLVWLCGDVAHHVGTYNAAPLLCVLYQFCVFRETEGRKRPTKGVLEEFRSLVFP